MRRFLISAVGALAFSFPSISDAEPVGILTFTVDNLTTDFFEDWMPEFFAQNVPGSLFGQTEPMTGAPGDLYWEHVRILKMNGWEFGAHGYSHHVKMSEADDDTLELELGAPAAYIYRGTGEYPTTLATPFGDYDERVLARIRIYYDAHVRAWGNDGINQFDATDHFRINRVQVDNQKSAEEVCADIERAGKEGHWLVLMWHVVVPVPSHEYESPVEQFQGAVKCAADMRDQGIVRLMTVKEALKLIPNMPR